MVGVVLFLLSIILATSLGVAAFVLMVNSDQNIVSKQLFKPKRQVVLITPDGDIIDTKEGLDVELEILNQKLREKQDQLIKSKERITNTLGNIQRLVTTKHEISKHFANLRYEIDKAEKDCKDLKERITNYSEKKDVMESGDDENELDTCQKILEFMTMKNDGLDLGEIPAADKTMLNEPLPPVFEGDIITKM